MKKVAVISGGSSGIGKAAACKFHENGYIVYELSRSGMDSSGINHIKTDVSKADEVKAAFGYIEEKEGRIDVFINNAGMGISGAMEFSSEENIKKLFDVNLMGCINCIQAVTGLMRRQGSGRIVNVSSVAAEISIPYQSFYSASKAAVNALTLALRSEIKPFGIKVSAVMPGDTKTGFTAAREKEENGDSIYNHSISSAVSAMEKDEINGMTSEKVADVIYKAATVKNPGCFYTVGFKYKAIIIAAKLLPVRLTNAIVGKMYS